MPFESEAQRKAMYAASKGKSILGIPEKVAKKFIKHSVDNIPNSPTVLSTPEFEKDEGSQITEARNQLNSIKHEIKAIAQKVRSYKGDGLLAKVKELNKEEVMPRLGEDDSLGTEKMEHLGSAPDEDPCWEGYEQIGMKEKGGKSVPNCVPETDSEAWQTKEGKNKNGGLNEKGRESYNKSHGGHLKAPQPEGGARKNSFCARMKGMKSKLTSAKTANDPNSRINKSLKKWNCDEEAVSDAIDVVPEMPMTTMPINKDAGALGRSAGILFLTPDGETLMIRRGDGGDYPNTWCVPGGHQGKEDEDLESAARRECFEETGIDYQGPLDIIHDDGQFRTYIARDFEKQDVELNYESTGYDWSDLYHPPLPLHPGLAEALQVAKAKTEYDIAELIKDDILTSPQMYANIGLFAIRITGTGLAYRSSIGEHVWRDPSLYINDEFLKRCNGLMVIMDHPQSAVLTSQEFKDRAIGSIMLPYIKGDEVWGIAKIYDQDAINLICEGEISTSPSVVFDNTAGNTTLTTENGEPLLIEGVPFLLDHIAIVTKARGSKGVWDKGGEPAGVLLTNPEVSDMNENRNEPKADANGDKLDAILSALDNISARVDAMEKDLPAPPLVTATDKKVKKDEDEAMMDEEDCPPDMKKDEMTETEAKKVMMRKKDAEADCPPDMKKPAFMKKDAMGEVQDPGNINFKEDADEDEEAKMDAMEAVAMKKDEEEGMYADAQAKADSVLSAFGKSASRPLQGESLTAYRKRLLRGLQAYSDSYKDINLIKEIKGEKMLSLAEKQIFNDALVAAKSPTMYAADAEYEINERDRSGRTITKFKGGFQWLDSFKVPSMRVRSFNLNPNNQR